MLFDTLTAGANAAAPQTKFGIMEALFPANGQPNYVGIVVLLILAFMLFYSVFILIVRYSSQAKILKQQATIPTTFWRAANIREGAAKLEKNTAYRQLADDALLAEDQHAKMADAMDAHDWLHGSLARSEASINSQLSQGLPFLATTGATAPFVGLFGTVIGIYRALINIGIAGSASIDKVAGPVGEALIMTAIGLLAAVPAVLAYNFLQGRNKRIAEGLSSFSNDLLANINSKGAIRPTIVTAPTAKAAPAKPAATPGTAAKA